MSYFLIIVGLVIVGYTVVAYFFGFPQLSDFLPVGFLYGRPSEQFYKIVPSNEMDTGPWYAIGLGVALILIGALIKYVVHR